ncbi:MAG: hypothetical protein J5939_02260 [Bacteroidales bacterium]|nr:hypothetical protein [Bacteroidales bacterium]
MKKILITYLSLLLLGSGAASAQRDLQSFPVFQGKVVPGRQMVTTEVRGASMATYQLDYYRGVSFQVGEELAGKVSALVEADAADADIRETEKTGHLLTYALVKPASKGKSNRYLCYQARPVGGEWKITLLYLEGPATLEDLRAMFEKQ